MQNETLKDKLIEQKKLIAELLKKAGIINDKWTGEIIIGIGEGGIKFIRRSETLK